MPTRKLILAALLLAAAVPSLALAEPATAAFAPAQLGFARAALEQARAAQAMGEVDRARKLASQAAVDARLAWGMTDSAWLRRQAAEIHERSARLRYELSVSGGPITARSLN